MLENLEGFLLTVDSEYIVHTCAGAGCEAKLSIENEKREQNGNYTIIYFLITSRSEAKEIGLRGKG